MYHCINQIRDLLEGRETESVAITALFAVSITFVHFKENSWISLLLNPEKLAEVIGPYGPAGVITGQLVQVIIAPIPPVTPVASGILYGPWYGMILSVIGAAAGSVLAVFLSRRYGRPVVEKFVSDSVMERFDSLTEKTGFTPFVILFVLPGFPDDALCFIAGLTKLNWRLLALIASLGRIPGILMLTTTGHSLAEADVILFSFASTLIISISLLSIRYREEIEVWTSRNIHSENL